VPDLPCSQNDASDLLPKRTRDIKRHLFRWPTTWKASSGWTDRRAGRVPSTPALPMPMTSRVQTQWMSSPPGIGTLQHRSRRSTAQPNKAGTQATSLGNDLERWRFLVCQGPQRGAVAKVSAFVIRAGSSFAQTWSQVAVRPVTVTDPSNMFRFQYRPVTGVVPGGVGLLTNCGTRRPGPGRRTRWEGPSTRAKNIAPPR
jgi:hypothetical protein